MYSRIKMYFVILTFVLSLVGITPKFTSAQEGGETKSYERCIGIIEPVQEGQTESKLVEERCFDVPADALAFLTKGQVSTARTTSWEDVDAAYQNYATMAAPAFYVIFQMRDNGTIYYQYLGLYLCSSSTSYAVANIGSTYNDRADSGSSFSQCNNFTVYEHSNFGGVSLSCTYSCTFGVLSNEVTSWRARQ